MKPPRRRCHIRRFAARRPTAPGRQPKRRRSSFYARCYHMTFATYVIMRAVPGYMQRLTLSTASNIMQRETAHTSRWAQQPRRNSVACLYKNKLTDRQVQVSSKRASWVLPLLNLHQNAARARQQTCKQVNLTRRYDAMPRSRSRGSPVRRPDDHRLLCEDCTLAGTCKPIPCSMPCFMPVAARSLRWPSPCQVWMDTEMPRAMQAHTLVVCGFGRAKVSLLLFRCSL